GTIRTAAATCGASGRLLHAPVGSPGPRNAGDGTDRARGGGERRPAPAGAAGRRAGGPERALCPGPGGAGRLRADGRLGLPPRRRRRRRPVRADLPARPLLPRLHRDRPRRLPGLDRPRRAPRRGRRLPRLPDRQPFPPGSRGLPRGRPGGCPRWARRPGRGPADPGRSDAGRRGRPLARRRAGGELRRRRGRRGAAGARRPDAGRPRRLWRLRGRRRPAWHSPPPPGGHLAPDVRPGHRRRGRRSGRRHRRADHLGRPRRDPGRSSRLCHRRQRRPRRAGARGGPQLRPVRRAQRRGRRPRLVRPLEAPRWPDGLRVRRRWGGGGRGGLCGRPRRHRRPARHGALGRRPPRRRDAGHRHAATAAGL
ncbi:MAG: hypothetical protein AVDCRST_MAG49-3719, partial [uncultured Thermomicrobiales bacterium]